MDEDTAFWAALAAEYLRSLFAAAMLAGLDARAVAGWIRGGTFAEAGSILRAHGMDVHARQLAGSVTSRSGPLKRSRPRCSARSHAWARSRDRPARRAARRAACGSYRPARHPDQQGR